MIGHNRKATMGVVNSVNAHPFHEDNIVLVHNGTLRGGHKQLANTEVDSHAVCHAFAEKGAEEVLKTLDAAFAFIWWDVNKNKLYAVRNDERPLNLVQTDDLNVLCSEPWMAHVLLARMGTKVTGTFPIDAGELYEFSLDGTFKISKVDLRPPTVYNNTSHYMSGRTHPGRGHWTDDDDYLETPPVKMIGTTGSVKPSNGTVIPPITTTTTGTSQTPTPSNVCALTIATPFATNDHYKKEELVLLKVLAAQKEPSKEKYKLTGSIIEPGKPVMDFVAYLPGDTTKEDLSELMDTYAVGNIIGFANSTCGPSAWIKHLGPAKDIVKVHNTDVPQKVWEYVHKHVHCKDCNSGIHDEEAAFTSVSKAKNYEYRVSCADCIESKLTPGEVQNVFTQRRLDALQNRKPVVHQPADSVINLDKKGSSPTIH